MRILVISLEMVLTYMQHTHCLHPISLCTRRDMGLSRVYLHVHQEDYGSFQGILARAPGGLWVFPGYTCTCTRRNMGLSRVYLHVHQEGYGSFQGTLARAPGGIWVFPGYTCTCTRRNMGLSRVYLHVHQEEYGSFQGILARAPGGIWVFPGYTCTCTRRNMGLSRVYLHVHQEECGSFQGTEYTCTCTRRNMGLSRVCVRSLFAERIPYICIVLGFASVGILIIRIPKSDRLFLDSGIRIIFIWITDVHTMFLIVALKFFMHGI